MRPNRKTDRRHALCLIFAREFQQEDPMTMDYYADFFAQEVAGLGFSEADYIQRVYDGVFANLEKIDRIIDKTAVDWDLDRISKMDLAIMRLAIFEILHEKDINAAVAINEAVEIAKEFSDDDAGKFINGILEKVRKKVVAQAKRKRATNES